MNFHLSALATVGALALSPVAASAHPMLVRSTPKVGAKIKAPENVSIWFSEKIEPVFNRIEVVDGAGTHFEEGKPTLDGADKALLHMRLKPLPVGSYKVRWRITAADSHKMEGAFSFEVVP